MSLFEVACVPFQIHSKKDVMLKMGELIPKLEPQKAVCGECKKEIPQIRLVQNGSIRDEIASTLATCLVQEVDWIQSQ